MSRGQYSEFFNLPLANSTRDRQVGNCLFLTPKTFLGLKMLCFQFPDTLVKISSDHIMLTRLCYLDPLHKHLFYIVKLGFIRVDIILHFFALNHTLRTSWLYSYMSPSHLEIPNIFRQCHFYSQKYGRIIAYHVNMLLTETIYTNVHVSKNNSGLPCAPIMNLIFVYDF